MASDACGLREITVEGRRYRFLVRRHFVRSPQTGALSLTLRLFVMLADRPGGRLRALFHGYGHCASADEDALALPPERVAAVVQNARETGWSPETDPGEFAILDAAARVGVPRRSPPPGAKG